MRRLEFVWCLGFEGKAASKNLRRWLEERRRDATVVLYRTGQDISHTFHTLTQTTS